MEFTIIWFLLAGILLVYLVFFISFADRASRFFAKKLFQPSSQEFLAALSSTVNAPIEYEDEEVEVLNSGVEFMDSLLASIAVAKHSINITVYIWEAGEMSDLLIQTLQERAKHGVQIRILLDSFGSSGAPHELFKTLTASGSQVVRFRSPALGRLTRLHRRNHRRALVIDGKVGFTGGMAIADKWYKDTTYPVWRDTMFKVKGKLAQSLQSAFVDIWTGVTGEVLVGQEYYPLGTPAAPQGKPYIALSSSPSPDTHPLPKLFWLSLAAAQKSIKIVTPYFIPEKFIRDILVSQAKKGVEVTILLPGSHSDARPVRWASQFFYSELISAGVLIYEYQPSMIHSKYMLIDDEWVVFGSANMNIRSMVRDEENIIGTIDKKLGEALAIDFLHDTAQSIKMNKKRWTQRGIFSRAVEKLCWLFIEQF
ncbi:MAG TPA: phosphatidylserine/phosphatidylglycerophosphate/cardiolipin synthase family protein [Patescibacteria group bacterium]|nr:phosphatidylserine/phosphatidylglycerophosphate/cardiolipin synthase family protein [Patescibacteria group bacterium]